MIHPAIRLTPVALASLLLVVTTAAAQNPAAGNPTARDPTTTGPAIRRPAPPPVPVLQGPVVGGSGVEGSAVEGLPAYENASPYAGVLESPTSPDARPVPQLPLSADSPYQVDEPPLDPPHGPRLPGRVRSYIENRPRQLPLQTESWLNRPFSASFFLGGIFLGDPMTGLEGDAGIFYGGRFGWDFASRFGVEARMAGGSPGISSNQFNFELPQTNIFLTDLNWLFYPTGDTRWRPYLSAGTGLFDVDFVNLFNHRFHESLFEVPFGIGLKYRYSTRTVMRFELMDNFAFGTGLLNDMHNLSFTAGLETRFGGGNRKSYYPWKPDRDWR
jgi:hypothetical protein